MSDSTSLAPTFADFATDDGSGADAAGLEDPTQSLDLIATSSGDDNDLFQATGPNQTVAGSTTGPDTLVGGFDGDTLEGASGNDTFDYNVGGGAETIIATTDANGNHNNTLQFGAGIIPYYLDASVSVDGNLVLNTGNPDDNVTLGVIGDPHQFGIDHFDFSNGTSLSLIQLLSQIQQSFGTVELPSGEGSLFYEVDIGGPLYYTQLSNPSGQILKSETVEIDGTVDNKVYTYNPDGDTTLQEAQYSPDDLLLSNTSTTRDSQGRVISSDVTNADGSTVDSTYDYNADGSYTTTVVKTPAGGGAPITLTYNYDPNGHLITLYQATGSDQTVTGPSGGPDTLIGGYSGDVLEGGSGNDTFDYNVGGGAETIVATTDANGNHNNTLQFGAGVIPYYLDPSISVDGNLVLNTGNPDDNVTLGVIGDPYQFGIDHFDFSNGTSLSLIQLLSQIQQSFGTVELPSGEGSLFYEVDIGGPLYYVQSSNPSGQILDSETVEIDGAVDDKVYTYDPNGDTTLQEVKYSPGDLLLSNTSTTRDSQGRVISSDVTNADGSTVDSTDVYNTNGSHEQIVVTSPAGGGAPTTQTYNYDANGNLITGYQATGPDQTITGPSSGPNALIGGYSGDVLVGTSGSDIFEYNSGSGAETVSETAPVSSTSDNVIQFGSGITLASIGLSVNADGALVLSLGSNGDRITINGFNLIDPIGSSPIQQFEFSDGTSLALEQLLMQVQGPEMDGTISHADGTSTIYDITPGNDFEYYAQTDDPSGRETEAFIIRPNGATQDTIYTYNSDGSYVQTMVLTDTTGATTTFVTDDNAQGQTTYTLEKDPGGGSVAITYDSQGRALTQDIIRPDGSTQDTTYTYNSSSGDLTTRSITNPDGSTELDTFDAQGREVTVDDTGPDGSTSNSSYSFNADGSTVHTEVDTPAGGGGATTAVWNYDSSGNLTTKSITYPGGYTELDTFDAQGREVTVDTTAPDGSTSNSTYSFNADGSTVHTEVDTPAGGGGATTAVWNYDSSGNPTTKSITYPDGSTELDTFDAQGREVTVDDTGPDGSTSNSSYSFNADGSTVHTEVDTPAGGGGATTAVWNYDSSGNPTTKSITYPDGSTELDTFDAQGREVTVNTTGPDGSTSNSSYSFNADGSTVHTEVDTPAGGGGATTAVWNYDSSGNLTTKSITYPGGYTELDTFDAQGREVTVDTTAPDGSTSNSTYSFNADGSYVQTEVNTPAGGGAVTTTVWNYDSSGNVVSENQYAPTAGGSYGDSWNNSNGSKGVYWWNASTLEYQATWYDAGDGLQSTDNYQYSAGGSPGTSGASFIETYSDSAGDSGTRQYNASTGITSVSWYSAATGQITGTVTDSGFIGLQNDGELTNTQNDPSFFNPTTSPAFQHLLAGH